MHNGWLNADRGIPILTPNSGGISGSGPMSGFEGSNGSSSQNNSATPEGDQSTNGPTPKSSSNGGEGVDGRGVGLSARQNSGPGQDPFQMRPMSPREGQRQSQQQQHQHQHLNGQRIGGQQSHQGQRQGAMMDSGRLGMGVQGFYNDVNTINMGSASIDQPGNFPMPGDWGNFQGTPAIPPPGEGVLRALMNMGPMDAMDLSSWDTANENTMS